MPGSDRFHRLWRVIAVVVAGIVLITATEFALLAMHKALPRWGDFKQLESKIDALENPDAYDVLFLGDSTALHGLHPPLFEKLTGLRTYNFATIATVSSFANVYLLQKYLERHPAPRAIVVLVNMEYLTAQPSPIAFHQYFYDPDVAGILQEFDPRFGVTPGVVLANILPSYGYREQIIRGLEMVRTGTEEEPMEDGYFPKYDQIIQDDHQIPPQLLEYGEGKKQYVWTPNITLLQKLCGIAEDHDIGVYIRLGPLPQAAYAHAGITEYAAGVVRHLIGELADYPHCAVDTDISFYPHTYMADRSHTNHTGALILTRAVAERMRSLLGL